MAPCGVSTLMILNPALFKVQTFITTSKFISLNSTVIGYFQHFLLKSFGYFFVVSIKKCTFALLKKGWFPEWPNGADCKSAASRFGGSNPSPPTCKGGPRIALGSPFFISNLYIFLNDFC